ncbi:MAG: type II/IV secretion system protein [Chloroflexi bacterium]|nr:MAG: type II/IV secretion system protein [Chloroflexota bacterium]TME15161.1 MAG: type II/IV secretion system protein [Chloroflexota bacterium]
MMRGLITEEQLARALDVQRLNPAPVGALLVSQGAIEEDALTLAISEQLGTQVADLKHGEVDAEAARLIPEDFARRNLVLPLRRVNGRIAVAMSDPGNLSLINDLRLMTGLQIEAFVAGRTDILAHLSRVHSVRPRLQQAARSLEESRPQMSVGVERTITLELGNITAASPAVEIVNLLITQGLRDRASDIHIEPQREFLRIRLRIDGVLQDVAHLPNATGAALASRVKIMAGMNIVERRRAQDGQISLNIDGRELDCRVATIETIWGEKLVLRLLDRSRSLITLPQLGFSKRASSEYHRILHSPYGMLIVSGPTGSGKTTTLYASINELDKQVRNIMTIEDPVEYMFDDINQSQINKLADISFAHGLRAILRQDPDIILVGEIRDRETAEIAVQSALTGHLVLSSLHATDAVGALLRFIDMGIEGFLVASSVNAIVAQRLVRKICEACREPYEPGAEELDFANSLGLPAPKVVYRGQGCSRCNMTGYFDRIGVFEVLAMNDRLKRLVIARASHREIVEAAVAGGMVPLRADAWDRVMAGVTTVSEVLRSVYII